MTFKGYEEKETVQESLGKEEHCAEMQRKEKGGTTEGAAALCAFSCRMVFLLKCSERTLEGKKCRVKAAWGSPDKQS